jgi:kynurenine formamidase
MKLFLKEGVFIDTDQPLDISILLVAGSSNLTAWYVEPPSFEPVRANGFVGSIAEGGSVNFRDIFFNPHGHGTHTECLGHITRDVFSINQTLRTFFCSAMVISIQPEIERNDKDGRQDMIVRKAQVEEALQGIDKVEALIIRSLPNKREEKIGKAYSDTNPPYFETEIVELLDKLEVKHLLVDLPSVDRESDEGKLAFHHLFWKVPENPNHERTITELVFVGDKIKDGAYVLDLQVAPFENDASPSRPVLYQIIAENE